MHLSEWEILPEKSKGKQCGKTRYPSKASPQTVFSASPIVLFKARAAHRNMVDGVIEIRMRQSANSYRLNCFGTRTVDAVRIRAALLDCITHGFDEPLFGAR